MIEKYSQKKTFYNPKTSSIILLTIAVGLIYLIFKSDSLRNSLIQIFGVSNDFMLKHF